MPLDPAHLTTLRQRAHAELREAWASVFGHPPAITLGRECLCAYLAWQIQAQDAGGFTPSVQRKLNRLVAEWRKGKNPVRPRCPARLQPGTSVRKTWRGRTYTVVVQKDGFAFEGQCYRSLSQIARRITGTRWSGPAFFNVRRTTQSHEKTTADH